MKKEAYAVKSRSLFWDNYKGILIFLVVFAHFLYSYANAFDGSIADEIATVIYTFHMPAFVFCSGFMSQSADSRGKRSLIKLMVYYLVFNTAMCLFALFMFGERVTVLTPSYSFWYILSLVCWRLAVKPLSRIKGIIPLSLVITILIGYSSEFTNLLAIRRTVAFFPFFILGYKLDKEKVLRFLSGRGKTAVAAGCCGMIVLLAGVYCLQRVWDFSWTMLLMGKYVEISDVAQRACLLLIAFAVIALLFLAVPDRKVFLLTKMGKNSLPVFLGHRVITLCMLLVLPSGTYRDSYLLIALLMSVVTGGVLSLDCVNRWMDRLCGTATDLLLTGEGRKGEFVRTGSILIIIGLLLVNMLTVLIYGF